MNNNIKDLVYKMLTESTGINMMDSGGGENRGWQRNQKKSQQDFENDPAVSFDVPTEEIESSELEVTISVYHYLTSDKLELDELCEKFNSISNKDWDSDIYGVSKKQAQWLEKQGFETGEAVNTYNGDSNLSQILQYTYLKLGVEVYVALQIHNGCDARGGYTDAKLFHVIEEYMPSEDIYGTIDGQNVSNTYNGYSLTIDDDNGSEKTTTVKPDSDIQLSIY